MSGPLRLWRPDADAGLDDVAPATGSPAITPDLTLNELFSAVLLPQLEARGRRGPTIQIYRDTLAWWAKLTGDPPIRQIDQRLVNDFRTALGDARWRRGKVGDWRKLSAWSRTKYLRTLRALLGRLGTGTQARPGEELLRRVPWVDPAEPDAETKGAWSLEEARSIIRSASEARLPTLAERSPATWWRLLIGLAAYTGLRRGTLLVLRRRHMIEQPDGAWLDVPGELVSKTHKRTRVALHRLVAAEIGALSLEADDLLLPWPGHVRTIGDVHYRLQTAAGIPADQQHELHAWRRWHVNQLVDLGIPERIELARAALGHSSAAITTGHYLTAHLTLVRSLPDLW